MSTSPITIASLQPNSTTDHVGEANNVNLDVEMEIDSPPSATAKSFLEPSDLLQMEQLMRADEDETHLDLSCLLWMDGRRGGEEEEEEKWPRLEDFCTMTAEELAELPEEEEPLIGTDLDDLFPPRRRRKTKPSPPLPVGVYFPGEWDSEELYTLNGGVHRVFVDNDIVNHAARTALDQWNKEKGTNLDIRVVVKATQQIVNDFIYRLIFQASDDCYYEAEIFLTECYTYRKVCVWRAEGFDPASVEPIPLLDEDDDSLSDY